MPTQRPSVVHDGHPGQRMLAQQVHDLLDRGIGLHGYRVASMMSLTGRPRGATLADAAVRGWSVTAARCRRSAIGSLGSERQTLGQSVDHVAGHHVVGAEPAGGRAGREPVRERPERGGLEGVEPLASSAPMRPESTSPVPAVASAGLPPGLTATGPPGRGHDRVVPLQQHHGAALLRGLAGALPAGGAPPPRASAEQAARARRSAG